MRIGFVSTALCFLLAGVTLAGAAPHAAEHGEPTIAERYALARAVEHPALAPPGAFQAAGGEQYVFAFTRALNETNAHPVLKLTVLPLAVVLDFVLFPMALLADVMT